jgi:hypothetical protein
MLLGLVNNIDGLGYRFSNVYSDMIDRRKKLHKTCRVSCKTPLLGQMHCPQAGRLLHISVDGLPVGCTSVKGIRR